jgi:mannose-6-phosphate isomerase-like protein (cupin superfamily)
MTTAQIEAIDTKTAEHYVWGAQCDGWHLLKHPDLSVIEERVPPGAAEVKHLHSKARQFFYVLSGTATLEFDGHSQSFGTGQGMHVPPDTPHRFANHGATDVVFLVVSSPSTAGDRTNLPPGTVAHPA